MGVAHVERSRVEDQRIYLHDLSWSQYETLLGIRGERSSVRMAYLKGVLELTSPSLDHEIIKKTIARLVETYADNEQIDLIGCGSWTVRKKLKERGLEPDECYMLGAERLERPDLAIEVVWTHGGVDKLEIYHGLGVPEVWIWQEGVFEVNLLRDDAYEAAEHSQLLPDLDLTHLASFVENPNQAQAVREYRASLRTR